MILSKVNPLSKTRLRRRTSAAVVGVLLLAGCLPSPAPEDTAGLSPDATPPQAAPPPPISGQPKTFAALDLPLDPLANKDQLLRSFQSGRKDPFGNVIVTQKMPLAKAVEAEAGTATVAVGSGSTGSGATGSGISSQGGGSAGENDAACDSLKRDLQITGLIHGAGSSEAIVVNAQGETGSLRPGDRGGRSTTLLPPGCQVQSIDVNAGSLVIAPVNKGRPVRLAL